jgi:hypothetical protein
VEAGLVQQGFKFTPKRVDIKNSKASYVFTEFSNTDEQGKKSKLYHFYGNLPSGNHFVEVSFFHQGPKEEFVRLIFTLVVNNLYIGDERFYNPYLK